MDEGLDPPCLELGDTAEHRLLTWAGRRQNRQGFILLSDDRVAHRMTREVPGAGPQTLRHLIDGGWIKRYTSDYNHRWRILVYCTCGGENRHQVGVSRQSVGTVYDGTGTTSLRCSDGVPVGAESGVKSESVQKRVRPTTTLARDFFPQVMRGTGIEWSLYNWSGLAHRLSEWPSKYGISISDIRLMMEEFARHPEWCRRSKVPPWRVFLAKREELASRVTHNKREHPGNRKYINDSEHWVYHPPRRTPAVNYAT